MKRSSAARCSRRNCSRSRAGSRWNRSRSISAGSCMRAPMRCAARSATRSNSTLVIAGGLWNTLVDRHHLQSVLVNLAVNARDAMDGAGRADHRGCERAARSRLHARRRTRRGRRIRADHRLGHWLRHDTRRTRSRVRTVLHDQVRRTRHRPRPEHGVRFPAADGRRDQPAKRDRAWHDGHAAPAAHARRRGAVHRYRERARDRRRRNDSRRRGRSGRARDRRRDAGATRLSRVAGRPMRKAR